MAELWASRSLVRLLAKKDFFAKYRRASLGLIWAVGLPLMQAAVFTIVFSRVARLEVEGNYGLFVFAGMVPWTFFLAVVLGGTMSIVSGSTLANKTYFPRAVLPLVSLGVETYGLIGSVAVLLVGIVAIGDGLGARAFLLVPALALLLVLSASFALLLGAVQVYFRDTQYIVQAVTRAWLYVTPVLYPISLVPEGILRRLIQLNPATGVVELFRAGLFPPEPGWLIAVWWSLGWAALLVVLAAAVHRRFDRLFVDLL